MKTEREKQGLIEKYHSEIVDLQKLQDEDRVSRGRGRGNCLADKMFGREVNGTSKQALAGKLFE